MNISKHHRVMLIKKLWRIYTDNKQRNRRENNFRHTLSIYVNKHLRRLILYPSALQDPNPWQLPSNIDKALNSKLIIIQVHRKTSLTQLLVRRKCFRLYNFLFWLYITHIARHHKLKQPSKFFKITWIHYISIMEHLNVINWDQNDQMLSIIKTTLDLSAQMIRTTQQ